MLKIRDRHGIVDRVKLLLILLIMLALVIGLFYRVSESEKKEQKKSASIKLFLEKSLEPVGSTMYIWGGGWNDADSNAGTTSTQIGLSAQWERFAIEQDETYDFREYRFERENGLDCSGYVGWVVYNTFEKKDNQPGYVTISTQLAENLANRGWGTLLQNPKEFLPGDVVSMDGHVWICLGSCADGSVLLVHSSPPGVSVCGTVVPQDSIDETLDQKDGKSIAEQLAEEYMTTYYPDWQEKYPNRTVSSSYLENVSVFRWNKDTMSDAEKMQEMKGEEIIVYMSPDI